MKNILGKPKLEVTVNNAKAQCVLYLTTAKSYSEGDKTSNRVRISVLNVNILLQFFDFKTSNLSRNCQICLVSIWVWKREVIYEHVCGMGRLHPRKNTWGLAHLLMWG